MANVLDNINLRNSVTVGDVDGGMVIRPWQANSSFSMIGTTNMSGNEYALLTDGTNTFLSGGANGYVSIRGGANDSSPSLYVNNSYAYVDNGNFGVGFTTPQHRLVVNGNIAIDGLSGGYKINDITILDNSSTYTRISNPEGAIGLYLGDSADRSNYYDNNYHYFRTANGSSTLGVWNSTGLGIGTTNPTTKLWVEGSGSTLATFNSTGTNNWTIWRENGTVRGYIGVGDNGALFTGATTDSFSVRSESDLHLGGGGNNLQMTLNGSGVGIGTTSPSAPLHIYQSSTTGLKLSRLNHDSIDLSLEGANRFVISNVTDSTDLMSILYDSGNVGIGTTSPNYKLSVYTNGDVYSADFYQGNSGTDKYNAIRVRGAMTSAVGYYGIGGSTTGNTSFRDAFVVGTQSAHSLNLATSDTARMTITSAGNVGIGTTSPSGKLHVYGGRLVIDQTLSGQSAIQFNSAGSEVGVLYRPSGVANQLRMFITNAGDVMTWSDNGRVGVGTPSPGYKLHVVNSEADDVTLSVLNSRAYGSGQGNYGASLHLGKQESGNNQPMGVITARPNSETNSTTGFMSFSTRNTTVQERMRIDYLGNVGIGTTNPTQKLQVAGGDIMIDSGYAMHFTTTADYTKIQRSNNALQFFTNSTGMLSLNDSGSGYFNGSGNFGFGTTSPGYKLHVEGNSYINATISSPTLTLGRYTGQQTIQAGSDDGGYLIMDSAGGAAALNWYTSDNVALAVGGGNVGIGITNPQDRLHVYSNYGDQLRLSQGGTTNYLNINSGSAYSSLGGGSAFREDITISHSDGNVGIGTTSPARKLHVDGAIGVNGSIGHMQPGLNVGTAQWNKIGTFYTSQGGNNLKLELHCGQGYNANFGQHSVVHVIFRTSNGSSNDNGFYGSCHWYVEGYIEEVTTIKVKQISASQYEFYGFFNNFFGNSFVKADCRLSDYWVSDSSLNTGDPTGTVITANKEFATKSNSWFGGSVIVDGSVGIGTGTPSYKLDITGNNISGVVAVRNSANGRDTLRSENAVGTRTFNIGNDGSGHGIVFVRNSSGTTTNYITGSGNSYFNGGNVGIGTTSPDRKLEVENTSGVGEMCITGTTGSTLYFKPTGSYSLGGNFGIFVTGIGAPTYESTMTFKGYGSGINNLMTLKGSGNVGIGTTSPSYKLHVRSADASDDVAYIHHDNPSQTSGTVLKVRTDAGDSSGYTLLDVQNNTGSALFVRGDRNVGIGTTTPDSKLQIANADGSWYRFGYGGSSDVYIDARTTYFRTANGGSNTVTIDSVGNVGIGTTTPAAKLQVGGGTSNTQSSVAALSGSYQGLLSTLSLVNQTANLVTDGGVALDFHLNSAYSPTGRITTRTEDASNPTSSYMQFFTYLNGLNERMRITSAGKVGIGTISPIGDLTISDGGGTGLEIFAQDANTRVSILSYDRIDNAYREINLDAYNYNFRTSGNIQASILNNGNVGIGTNNPVQPLQVDGNIYSNGGDIYVNGSKALIAVGDLVFKTYDTSYAERMRILANGQVGIGVTSVTSGYKMEVGGTIKANGLHGSTSVSGTTYTARYQQYFGALQISLESSTGSASTIQLGNSGTTTHNNNVSITNGNLTVNGTGSFTGDVIAYSSSDKRLKDNVKPIENALNKVIAIGGYEFNWNDNQDTYEGHDVGVIAQEVEEVLPEVVETRKDGYKAVKYEKIVPLLIEAIKDQQKQIDELKALLNGGTK